MKKCQVMGLTGHISVIWRIKSLTRPIKQPFLVFILLIITSCSGNQPISVLENGFINPPDSAKPNVWWHWLNGNISKKGITLDLESMRNEGIGGAAIFNLKGQAAPGPVIYGSDEWQELVNHAFTEARRLSLDLSFQNCGGWATSGGPWVTPDRAMKKLTYRKIQVKGSRKFSSDLDCPATISDYYKDVCILAFPADNLDHQNLIDSVVANFSCDKEILDKESVYDGDIVSEARILTDGGDVTFLFEFGQSFDAHSIFFKRTWPSWNGVNNFELAISQDNRNFRKLLEASIQNDFQVFEFIPVKAKFFKITVKGGFQDILRIPEIQFNRDLYDFLPALNDLNALAGFQVREKIGPKKTINSKKTAVKLKELVDLTKYTDKNGRLNWDVPEGNWTILRVGYTLTGKKNEGPPGSTGYESDKLSAEATREYFDGMKHVLFQNREKFIGKTLKSILTDSWECLNQNWTSNFPEEFEKRRGYPIYPYLPVISGELVENDDVSYRFLWDFRRTIADLIAENYYGEMAKLCHKAGIKLESEASGAQQALKDPINYSSRVDIPMTEFWAQPFKTNGSFTDAISGAHLYGKKVVSAEAFTSAAGDWQLTPSDLKVYGDQIFCLGINMLRFHSFTHQADETFPGWQMNPWGIAMNRKMPWWDHASGYFKYLQRTQYMLQQGKPTADVLLFYSEGAQTDLNSSYGNNVLSYLPKGYHFDGCDQNTIINRLTVDDHKLVLPDGTSYSLLVLPEKLQNTPVLLAKIRELVKNGAIVYGQKPVSSPSLNDYPHCDTQVQKLADELWGEPDTGGMIDHTFGKGKVIYGIPVQKVLNTIIIPDFEYESDDPAAVLDFNHRTYGATDYYFISNQESHTVQTKCRFRVTGKIPELWDPETGLINKVQEFEQEQLSTIIPICLESGSSIFVVFNRSARQKPLTELKHDETLHSPKDLTMMLTGPWQVTFDPIWGGPGEVIFDTLISWTERPEEGIKYYSGKVIYKNEFEIDGGLLEQNRKIVLDLGEIRETARVYVNSKERCTLWRSPYKSDISGWLKPGKNILRIEVANSWPNRVIGDLNSHNGKTYTWSNSTDHYNKDSKLLTSGLLGPVSVKVTWTR